MESFQELHFINASRFEEGKFSCAVDCFLEIWLRKLSCCFGERTESYLIRLLNSISSQYESLREECRMLGSPTVSSQIQIKAFNLHILRDDI